MRYDVYNGFTSRVSYSHKAVLEVAVLRLIELLYLKRTSEHCFIDYVTAIIWFITEAGWSVIELSEQ